MSRQPATDRPDDGPLARGGWTAKSLAPLAALLALVAIAWCSGTNRWTADAWNTPLQYSDGFYGDVLTTLASMKAVSAGHLLPFTWKIVPELGAPFDGNWADWPSNEDLLVLFAGMSGRAFGLFAGLNVALLTGHLLAAATFFLVARVLGISGTWAFVGGLAYGLAPSLFAQAPHHIGVAYAWHVPLFILVWKWIGTEPGLAFGSRQFQWAVAIAALAGLLNVYYANILCQLVLLTAAVMALRQHSTAALKPALAVVAAAVASFALMNLDTWTYRVVHGPSGGGVVREYKWLEIYGLKLVDLVVPPVTHHGQAFASFAAAHRATAPLQDEGSYLGLVGIAALGLLVATAVGDCIRRRADAVPMEAWWVLWIVLCFSTGGLNAILGAAGFTLFRTGCRYSIVILAIALMYAAKRLSDRDAAASTGRDGQAPAALLAAAVLSLVILWDQVPRTPTRAETAAIVGQIASDREFVARMEAALPPGAMVFQLPVMRFPEEPAPGVPPYDHLRPYLFSRHLRFSFGSMKGRQREQWQQEIFQGPFDKAVAELRNRGFAAVYVNRNAFPDKGRQLVDALRGLGCTKPAIESAAGDLVCVPLD